MKKRSRAVPLILLGTLTLLTGCDRTEPVEVQQSTYASREDCVADWGQDDRDCRPAGSATGGHYYGPRYYWHHGGGYPVAMDPDGSKRPLTNSYLNRPGTSTRATGITSHGYLGGTRTSRGGFGGFMRGFSGG